MKVAIIHDYLNVFGGAEGVVEAIYEIYPNADIYTAEFNKQELEEAKSPLANANVIYPKWNKYLKGKIGKTLHLFLIANLPLYFRTLNLSKYDLVISSTAHFAKGVKTNKDQLHISYIHTPPRFLYGYPETNRKRNKWYFKPIIIPLDFILKRIDLWFAKQPDYLLCNSKEVQSRIKKFYKRDATVIYPFANVKEFKNKEKEDIKNQEGTKSKSGNSKNIDLKRVIKLKDYYLMIGRIVEYKNFHKIADILGKNNISLVIGGKGPDTNKIDSLSKKYNSVSYLGFISEKEKAYLLENCNAFIIATEHEDSGMTAFEPMLYGKPTISLHSGGLKETIKKNINGVFINNLEVKEVLDAIKKIDTTDWDKNKIKAMSNFYTKKRFKEEFKKFITKVKK